MYGYIWICMDIRYVAMICIWYIRDQDSNAGKYILSSFFVVMY